MPDDKIFRRPETEDEPVRDRPEATAQAPDQTAAPDAASDPAPADAAADPQATHDADTSLVHDDAVGGDQEVAGTVPGGDGTAVHAPAAEPDGAAALEDHAVQAGPEVPSVGSGPDDPAGADEAPALDDLAEVDEVPAAEGAGEIDEVPAAEGSAEVDEVPATEGAVEVEEVASDRAAADQPTTAQQTLADVGDEQQASPDPQPTTATAPAEPAGDGDAPDRPAEVPPPVLPVPPELRAPATPDPDDPAPHAAAPHEEPRPSTAPPSPAAAAGTDPSGTEPVSESPAPAAADTDATGPGDTVASGTAGQTDGSSRPPEQAAGPSEDAPTGGPVTEEPAEKMEPRPTRTFRDWLRPDLRQTVIAILLAAFSFAVVTQIRARDQVDSYSTLRQSDLVAMLDGLNQESQRLESELDSLRQAQAELESGQDSAELARAQAEERLTSLGILAGTLPAQGPGVTLTISDPQRNVKPGMLLDAVEEMRDAGAEAIQVNDTIRVVASSWVSSGASGIIIDGQAVSTPITIDVIGDPHSLEEAARFRGGLVSQITDPRVGGQVSIVRSDNLVISALHRPEAPRYARPDDSAEGEGATTGD